MIVMETDRLYARRFTMDDLDHYFSLNGDEEVMRYIRAPKSRIETEVLLREAISKYDISPCDMRIAIFTKDPDEFVGSFAVIPVDKSTDIQMGYSFLKKHWGKGYASEIVKEGLLYATGVLGLTSIAGITETENVASQKVLLRTGFVFERSYAEGEKMLNLYRFRVER